MLSFFQKAYRGHDFRGDESLFNERCFQACHYVMLYDQAIADAQGICEPSSQFRSQDWELGTTTFQSGSVREDLWSEPRRRWWRRCTGASFLVLREARRAKPIYLRCSTAKFRI
jgi:hypothetical protein